MAVMGRGAVIAALAAGTIAAMALPASSIPPPNVEPREALRLHLLDTCVMNASRQFEPTENFARDCDCATKRTIRDVSEEQIASFADRGRIDRDLEASFSANFAACS